MTHAPRVIMPPIDTYSPEDDWRQHARCRGIDTAVFFPCRGEDVSEAKAICAQCPVREPCLADGMRERFGIRGGLSERERRTLRRKRGAA